MKKQINLKNKKTLILVIVILILLTFFLIFLFEMAKNNKFGNNNISQEESLKKILNMTSYEAKIEELNGLSPEQLVSHAYKNLHIRFKSTYRSDVDICILLALKDSDNEI